MGYFFRKGDRGMSKSEAMSNRSVKPLLTAKWRRSSHVGARFNVFLLAIVKKKLHEVDRKFHVEDRINLDL